MLSPWLLFDFLHLRDNSTFICMKKFQKKFQNRKRTSVCVRESLPYAAGRAEFTQSTNLHTMERELGFRLGSAVCSLRIWLQTCTMLQRASDITVLCVCRSLQTQFLLFSSTLNLREKEPGLPCLMFTQSKPAVIAVLKCHPRLTWYIGLVSSISIFFWVPFLTTWWI